MMNMKVWKFEDGNECLKDENEEKGKKMFSFKFYRNLFNNTNVGQARYISSLTQSYNIGSENKRIF